MNRIRLTSALLCVATTLSLGACLEAVTEVADVGGPPANDTGVDAAADAAGDARDDARADATPGDTSNDTSIDASGVVLNEIAPAGDPDDWFELYNTGDVAVDLAAWTFSDRTEDPRPVPFLDGSTIAPGGYLFVQFDDTYPGFGLGGADSFVVYGPDGEVGTSQAGRRAQRPTEPPGGGCPTAPGHSRR